ncbi:MAG: alpha,alpha-trehalose-phosphate synthase (UDP-forming) [Candidatus Competibacteraceae bacterium]|nr:alpha,alpha-trehalose-phosphate synthase (UDP-forming) [Candidatus Competibacteraceae bacterium]
MSRLFVVSNRVAVPTADKPAAGGLAVALLGALREHGGIWFGWSGKVGQTTDRQPQLTRQENATFATIDLAEQDYQDFYAGYSNRSLWPLFHYRTDLTTFDRRYQAGYYRVNSHFAQTIAPLVEPDDMLWVHDYHLIPLGGELRRQGLGQRMGFFLHIPFPAPQILVALPDHQRLVRDLFGYDLVGFQTQSDVQALRDYVVEEAGGRVEADGRLTAFGRTITARAFPIGMEVEPLLALVENPEVQEHTRRMHKTLIGKRLLIGVDRLDYSKGLPQRLEGLEQLLDIYPEHQGKVCLLQMAAASRGDVPEYQAIRRQLEMLSGRINGRFGTYDWVPIRYQNQTVDRVTLVGLLRSAQVGLVTPLRDGMNLVAKEYVAAQDPKDPGVLILSRFAGAAGQFRDGALIVNPYDAQALAEAIHQALAMPLEERRSRWEKLMRVVKDYDIHWWRDSFIHDLEASQAPDKA